MESTQATKFDILIYNNAGDISIIRNAEDYVMAVLHDSEAVEARCEIKTPEDMIPYEEWSIWYKDRYSWHSVPTRVHCPSECDAWKDVMNYFDGKGFAGSDNARFETIESIQDFIDEIKDDPDYAEEVEVQKAMLRMIESA